MRTLFITEKPQKSIEMTIKTYDMYVRAYVCVSTSERGEPLADWTDINGQQSDSRE